MLPSVGVNTAPSTPSSFISGNIFLAWAVLIISSGMPNERANPTCRLSSSIRCGVDAKRKPPTSRQPVSCPVSSLSRRYRSVLYFIMRVRLKSERSWPTRPAECQVEPQVSSPRSRSTTSFHPIRVRW